MADPRELVTIHQAMRRLGVSRRTVYNWLERGLIEYVRTPGGNVRIVADSLTTPGVPRPRPTPAQQRAARGISDASLLDGFFNRPGDDPR